MLRAYSTVRRRGNPDRSLGNAQKLTGLARLMGAAIVIPDAEDDAFEEVYLLRLALSEKKPPTAVVVTGCNPEQDRIDDAIYFAIRKRAVRRQLV